MILLILRKLDFSTARWILSESLQVNLRLLGCVIVPELSRVESPFETFLLGRAAILDSLALENCQRETSALSA